jgi:RNA polymerase sigma-70 factor, ECF subfamily
LQGLYFIASLSQKHTSVRLIRKALPLETFDNLYKEYYHCLHRLAQKMVCYDSSNDIVQEVFADYFQKTQRGKKIEYPRSFLYRSTLNKCIDEQRKIKKFAGDQIPEGTVDGNRSIEKQEARLLISRCLETLNIRDRKLAVLYSEGLSYKEISEITGITFSSVGKTISRMLKKLEKELKAIGYEMH